MSANHPRQQFNRLDWTDQIRKYREQHIKAWSGLLRRKLPRPFANAHWTLLVCTELAWLLLLSNESCYESQHALVTALLTSTIWLTAWVSSLRFSEIRGWRKVAFTGLGAAYDLLLVFLIFVVVCVPIIVFSGTGHCYGPRAKVTELVLWASQHRAEINERYASQKTLRDVGKGIEFPLQGRVIGGFITADGVIITVGEDPAAVVMLTPTATGTELAWKCMVLPKKIAPVYCR